MEKVLEREGALKPTLPRPSASSWSSPSPSPSPSPDAAELQTKRSAALGETSTTAPKTPTAPAAAESKPLTTLLETANSHQPTAASLKLVKTIVKNVVEKAGDEKYTSIKLSGKAGQKLVAAPASMACLASLGFAKSADGETLAISTEAALVAGAAAPTAAAHLVAANTTMVQVAAEVEAGKDEDEKEEEDEAELARARKLSVAGGDEEAEAEAKVGREYIS